MFKYCKYISLFICLLFVFNIDVNAELKKSGDCIYNITGDGKTISVRINQTAEGKITYYYAFDKLTSASDSKWIEEKKDSLVSADGITIKDWDKVDSYDKCPNYAYYEPASGLSNTFFKFSDDASESGFSYSGSVVSGSALKNSTSTTGEGASCSQTSIDWLSAVPSIDKMDDNDHYCLYYGDSDDGCLVVQINYSLSNGVSANTNFSSWSHKPTGANLFVPFDWDKVKGTLSNICPTTLGITKEIQFVGATNTSSLVYSFKAGGYATLSLKTEASSRADASIDDAKIISDTPKVTKISSCAELLNTELTNVLTNIISFIRVLVPIILIALGVVDFGRAVFASDEGEMKKAQSKFIKRLIIGAVIFIIPNILKAILTIANGIWPVVDATLCGIL